MTFSGGVTGSLIDTANTAVWIETATKRGAVFIGQMVDTIPGHNYDGTVDSQSICHNFYGVNTVPLSGGSDPVNSCAHGEVDSAWQATGPGAATRNNQVWIFDPHDLIAVAQGSVPAYTPISTAEFPISDIQNCTIPQAVARNNQFNGAFYEPTMKKLFIAEQNGDVEGCCAFVPRIHVFAVNA